MRLRAPGPFPLASLVRPGMLRAWRDLKGFSVLGRFISIGLGELPLPFACLAHHAQVDSSAPRGPSSRRSGPFPSLCFRAAPPWAVSVVSKGGGGSSSCSGCGQLLLVSSGRLEQGKPRLWGPKGLARTSKCVGLIAATASLRPLHKHRPHRN